MYSYMSLSHRGKYGQINDWKKHQTPGILDLEDHDFGSMCSLIMSNYLRCVPKDR